MPECRLIVDPPRSGTWNMAVDEWLLRRANDEGVLSLRFYEWNEPTLSLGYFQSLADRANHPPSAELPVVRRASGGGALVHHHELTYSLAVPARHPLAAQPTKLYDAAHASLIEVLSATVQAEDWNVVQARETESHHPQPFLCFRRHAHGDVLIAHSSSSSSQSCGSYHKICGSAQRRRHGAVLQHGGVLLRRSEHAPELEGVGELCGREITAAELREEWIGPFAKHLALSFAGPQPLSPDEQRAARAIQAAKFAHPEWTSRR